MRIIPPIFLLCLVFSIGCSNRRAAFEPVIVELVGRDQTITIRSGQRGIVYSIMTHDGNIVVPEMSATELQVKHPDVYHLLESAIAAEGMFIDAQIGPPEPF